MFRASLSVLLIANLLACPLRCVSCEVGPSVSEQPAATACSCCSHDCDIPVPDAPLDTPDEDCSCQDCICEGATLQDAPELPATPSLSVFSVGWTIAVSNTGDGCRSCGALDIDDGGFGSCGRDRRIAQQSLLI